MANQRGLSAERIRELAKEGAEALLKPIAPRVAIKARTINSKLGRPGRLCLYALVIIDITPLEVH